MVLNIYELYSLAAYEFPESSKWMPEWLTKHKSFEQIKGSRIFKIFSQFGLNDFKESFENHSAIEDFKDLLISNLSKIVQSADNIVVNLSNRIDDVDILKKSLEAKQLEQVAYKLLQEMLKPTTWTSNKHRILTQVSSDDKKFRIDANTSIIKAYNIIKIRAAQLGINFSDIELTQEFKNYSKRGGFSVVFSTKPEDIAAMSSRSEWGSCMSIDSDKGLNACLLGSTLSKFIGIAYITSGKSFQGRGEEMLARCLVRFAIDTTNKKPVIILDKMYPGSNEKFTQAIRTAIQHKVSIEVHNIKELSERDDFSRFKIPEEKIPGINSHEKSYLDKPEVFTSKEDFVKDPVQFIRKYINDLSRWLAYKVAVYISKSQNFDINGAMTEARILAKIIVVKLTQQPGTNIAKHYRNGGKPMNERLIKKMFMEEIVKPIQKIKIKKIVNSFGDGKYIDYLSNKEFKDDLIEYIFSQLTNLPEEYVI